MIRIEEDPLCILGINAHSNNFGCFIAAWIAMVFYLFLMAWGVGILTMASKFCWLEKVFVRA